jgi:hypothetical protein
MELICATVARISKRVLLRGILVTLSPKIVAAEHMID